MMPLTLRGHLCMQNSHQTKLLPLWLFFISACFISGHFGAACSPLHPLTLMLNVLRISSGVLPAEHKDSAAQLAQPRTAAA